MTDYAMPSKNGKPLFHTKQPTAPHAVCIAALRAAEQERER